MLNSFLLARNKKNNLNSKVKLRVQTRPFKSTQFYPISRSLKFLEEFSPSSS